MFSPQQPFKLVFILRSEFSVFCSCPVDSVVLVALVFFIMVLNPLDSMLGMNDRFAQQVLNFFGDQGR